MSYIMLTTISAVFLALYDVLKKISVKNKKDIYGVLFLYTLISFFCSFIYISDSFDINSKYILFILAKAVLISVSWFLTMKAITKLDLGIVTPFSLMGTVFTTLLAWVFFNQSIGLSQILGSCVILIGLLLLSRIKENIKEVDNDYRYLLLLILAAFLSSISAIIDKWLLSNGVSRGAVLFFFFGFLALIYMTVYLLKEKKINIEFNKDALWIIGIGISIFLSDLFYYKAVNIDGVSLSLISIIRKLSVFIGVVLASLCLKEGNLLKKIGVLILMFIGLGFIILM